MTTLEVSDLVVEYASGGYAVRPLDRVTFTAEDGELVVLLGPSGCGKTTLLSCIAGLLTPTSGGIHLEGTDVIALSGRELAQYRRARVGVVFQAFNLIPSLSARGNVLVPLRLAGVSRRQARARAEELLTLVGLTDRLRHRPSQLSGGQQQRVAIARALVHDPPLVVADEPTAHLDHVQVEAVLRLLRDLAAPGRVVIVATHDERVARLADRVVDLAPEAVTVGGDPEPVVLAAGQILFKQEDPSDLVYVVDSGTIELVRPLVDGGEVLLRVVEAGGYFGELGPLLGLPRSATARARTESRLTGYPLPIFRQLAPTLTSDPANTRFPLAGR
jgi:putative ABC transport system ATP-binding protein